MTDLSADLVQQKQKLRERLRFRRRHFAANLDGMAQLAAFRALPAPLTELLAHHAVIGAYVAWATSPMSCRCLRRWPTPARSPCPITQAASRRWTFAAGNRANRW
jgi:hypothetical protein